MRVPFPYVEGNRLEMRPALVLTTPLGPQGLLVWTLMITAARRSSWAGDVPLGDRHVECGLSVPCLVRTEKIAAIEVATITNVMGRMPVDLMRIIKGRIAETLGIA